MRKTTVMFILLFATILGQNVFATDSDPSNYFEGFVLDKESEERRKFEENKKKNGVADKWFWGSAALLMTSSIVDAESTFVCIGRKACYETNGKMVPFVEAGRAPTYAIQAAINSGVMVGTYFAKGNYSTRKVWWVVPIVLSAAHFALSHRNFSFTITLPIG
jgi:hypothetical protein